VGSNPTLSAIFNARRREVLPMRKLIYAINFTLDGNCDHTKGIPDAEIMDFYTQLVSSVDSLIFGRKTYELMVPFWPDIAKARTGSQADIDYADAFVAAGKVVVSSSLPDPAEKNTRLIRTGLAAEIQKLKQQPGRDILTGGVDVPAQLIAAGLVDEFRFLVMPVFGGPGPRLFDRIPPPQNLKLKLVETKTFKSGSVAFRYVRA
jgi:dihydrofolate reductase